MACNFFTDFNQNILFLSTLFLFNYGKTALNLNNAITFYFPEVTLKIYDFFIFLFHAMADAFSDSVLMDCCGKHMQIFGSDYFIPKNDHCIRTTFPHNGIAYIEWSGNILPINYPDPFIRGFSPKPPNYEEALMFLTSYASSFDNWVPQEIQLNWENFFIKLNTSINLENLRRHHIALQDFVRKIRIENEKKS